MSLLYTYENDEGISVDLKCTICLDPFQSPVYDRGCGHVFCLRCIQFWLSQKRFCPLCRYEFTQFTSFNDENLLKNLQHSSVRCNNCQTGRIELRNFRDHKFYHCIERMDVDLQQKSDVDYLNVLLRRTSRPYERNPPSNIHYRSSRSEAPKLPVPNILVFIFCYFSLVYLLMCIMR